MNIVTAILINIFSQYLGDYLRPGASFALEYLVRLLDSLLLAYAPFMR